MYFPFHFWLCNCIMWKYCTSPILHLRHCHNWNKSLVFWPTVLTCVCFDFFVIFTHLFKSHLSRVWEKHHLCKARGGQLLSLFFRFSPIKKQKWEKNSMSHSVMLLCRRAGVFCNNFRMEINICFAQHKQAK